MSWAPLISSISTSLPRRTPITAGMLPMLKSKRRCVEVRADVGDVADCVLRSIEAVVDLSGVEVVDELAVQARLQQAWVVVGLEPFDGVLG